MCYFLTIAVPAEQSHQVAKVFGRGYQLFPGSKGLGPEAFPQDYEPYIVTSGMCSCGLYTSPAQAKQAREAIIVKSKRKQLRQQGWSEAKQRRAREQSEQHEGKKLQQHLGSTSGLTPEVTQRIDKLYQATTGVVLFVHWEDQENAGTLTTTQLRTCSLEQFPSVAKSLSVDVLLLIQP